MMETRVPGEPLASVTLGPTDEARRLWEGACEARARAEWDLVALCEALDLGIRAAEILLVHLLQPVKSRFPATVQSELMIPDPHVDLHHDAVAMPRGMQFNELLDLLSADDLECVGPHLHRGWEDRWAACARSRETARAATEIELDEAWRQQLLALNAYRNRLFRYAPPIRIVPAELSEAFPALVRLMEALGPSGAAD